MKFTNHIESIIDKAKSAVHAIIQLRKIHHPSVYAGFIRVYCQSQPLCSPQLVFHTYQRMTRRSWRGCKKLCLRVILPVIDNYEERLSYLNPESLSVHLDIACLKYVSKVSSNTDDPLARYQPQPSTTVKNPPQRFSQTYQLNCSVWKESLSQIFLIIINYVPDHNF